MHCNDRKNSVCFTLHRYWYGHVWENQGVCDIRAFLWCVWERRLDCAFQPGRPRRSWAAARTTKIYAIAVSTAVRSRVTATMSVALLLGNNWSKGQSNFQSPVPPPCSWSRLGLSWGSSSTSLLLISPGHAKASNSSWESSSPPSSWSRLDTQKRLTSSWESSSPPSSWSRLDSDLYHIVPPLIRSRTNRFTGCGKNTFKPEGVGTNKRTGHLLSLTSTSYV